MHQIPETDYTGGECELLNQSGPKEAFCWSKLLLATLKELDELDPDWLEKHYLESREQEESKSDNLIDSLGVPYGTLSTFSGQAGEDARETSPDGHSHIGSD